IFCAATSSGPWSAFSQASWQAPSTGCWTHRSSTCCSADCAACSTRSGDSRNPRRPGRSRGRRSEVPFGLRVKFLKVLVFVPVWFVVAAPSPNPPTPSPSPTVVASPTPTPTPSPSSAPSPPPTPTPTPLGANIVLDVAAGGPSTHINVTGTSFLPNEPMTLYSDTDSHVAANVTSDGNGNFTKAITPFPGDSPGVHHLCASVPPKPCANFALQGPPTPTPAASPSPSPS